MKVQDSQIRLEIVMLAGFALEALYKANLLFWVSIKCDRINIHRCMEGVSMSDP